MLQPGFTKTQSTQLTNSTFRKSKKAAAISVTCRRYYQIILFTTNQKQLGLWTRLIKVWNGIIKAIISVGTLLKSQRFIDCASQSKRCSKAGILFLSTENLSFKHANLVKCAVSERCRCRRGYCWQWQRQYCKGSWHCSYINLLHFRTSTFPFFLKECL